MVMVMAKTININVRLKQFKGRQTSSSTSVEQKTGTTSAKPKSGSVKGTTGLGKIGKFLGKGKGLVGTGAALSLMAGAFNTGGSISGTVTGNKFAEKRMKDTASAMIFPMGVAMKGIGRVFELQREMERVDIRRAQTNTYMPYRNGNTGITI